MDQWFAIKDAENMLKDFSIKGSLLVPTIYNNFEYKRMYMLPLNWNPVLRAKTLR